jgi:hypothetical protein
MTDAILIALLHVLAAVAGGMWPASRTGTATARPPVPDDESDSWATTQVRRVRHSGGIRVEAIVAPVGVRLLASVTRSCEWGE